MMQPLFPSGLTAVPHLAWGSHLAHFFGSGVELRDVLVPYFKAGLDNNERCLWVTGAAFNAEQARSALRAAVPDLDHRERRKQIEMADVGQWYATDAPPKPQDLVNTLMQRGQDALEGGYAGLRTNGNCAWVSPDQRTDFLEYEGLVHKATKGRPMVCICSYCVDQLQDGFQVDIMERHHLALPSTPRSRTSLAVGNARAVADEPEARRLLEAQKRTFDMAMTASKMGTWRYTFADNICIYDDNAQHLYGLTEARFVHDEAGARSKFHPDDLEPMWSRVSKALDPVGDGRYDVEYRVKQLDGSWRWLSAWGLVEFEGEGSEKKPVAIVGASRDISDRKQAEELQQLLLNELNHRVKNTLAAVQAITDQTLRTATDVASGRQALTRRIRSMARAHDLLTFRAWTGANLADVVTRALDAFNPAQISTSGDAIEVSPKHVLALSMALHELGTNASKYGALSTPGGRVSVWWDVQDGMLQMRWQESGGPPIVAPTRKGFGSRLLETLIARDLNGNVTVSYEQSGVRCELSARL